MTEEDIYQPHKKTPRVFYGYIVAAAAFLIMIVAWGLYIVFGIFFTPLLNEFGWTRAVTSGAYSLSSVLHGMLGIVMGLLTDKLGPRKVVTFCGIILALGYFLMSQVNSVWQLYLFYGIIVGIGMGGLWIPLLSPVARWFVGRRSMMTAIVVSGLTIGQMIAPPIVSRLIAAYDWRIAYMIVAGVVLVMVVVPAQFLKRDPSQKGLLPYGSEIEANRPGMESAETDYTLKEAVRTVQFWLVTAILFCFGFSAFALTVHMVPHAIELGFAEVRAANVLAINGGAGIVGNFFLGGLIADRIGNKKAFIIGFALATAALLWLIPAKEMWMLYLFSVGFGLALGSIGPSESPLVARLFGLSSHGLVYGVVGFGFTIGGAVGPWATGYLFDVFNNYQAAFIVSAAFSVLGIILVLMLRPTKKLGTSL